MTESANPRPCLLSLAAARLVLAAAAVSFSAGLMAPYAGAAERPRLVVLVVIDQFRYEYLQSYQQHFEDGGFRRFAREGASFTQAAYHHSTTDTCPGHAVIATGYWGNLNGIVANSWFDAVRGRHVDCAAAGEADRSLNLLRPTIGDALKQAGGGKYIVASGKRAAAIVLGGQSADAVFFPDSQARFDRLRERVPVPAWVQGFGDVERMEAEFGEVWTRLLPTDAYAAVGPDDVAAEAPPGGMGRTFPHHLNTGFLGVGPAFRETVQQSPFADAILADLAMAAVREEKLGQDAVADLLAVSFSANDRVGHNFGPDSHESMDTAVRLDRQVARLIGFLDRHVGLQQTLIVLTADHGVAALPEVASARGSRTAGRVPEALWSEAVEDALTAAYGQPLSGDWVAFHDFPNVFLDEVAISAAGARTEDAEQVAEEAIEALPGILAAYTRSDLVKFKQTTVASPDIQMVLLSFRADRSGHVVYQVLRDTVDKSTGTNHGSHWDYDTHVPLMWLGAGVPPGRYDGSVTPADIAPTLRRFLGLPADPEAPGRVLREVLPGAGAPPEQGSKTP